MKMVSEQTMEFLRVAYAQIIDDWFDDPDERFIDWTPADFAEWYERMITVAKDCGYDFWDVARAVATDYEIDRVQQMLRTAGVDFPTK